MYLTLAYAFSLGLFVNSYAERDFWEDVPCKKQINPDNCNFDDILLPNIFDYERCAPAKLPLYARNYYIGRSGRGLSYRENREAFDRIKIKANNMQDISHTSLETTVLGNDIAFPIGIAPWALQVMANKEAEKATSSAAASMGTVMILSVYSSIKLEEVAEKARDQFSNLWMQVYIFENISYTIDIVGRAERSGFKAIVLTCDSSIYSPIRCDANNVPEITSLSIGNAPDQTFGSLNIEPAVFKHITWLKSITSLPIVAKGIHDGDDARKVIDAGASAIIVSNHGGRQLDGSQGAIDALSNVVRAVQHMYPQPDIYLDSGVRSGVDVFKAIARGAKMVFVGRAAIWGLTLEGEEGVRKVLTILKEEFRRTMILAGAANPLLIRPDHVIPMTPNCKC